jgi:2-C-methyl-D-erythritol 4-phosphate cytidylyltransferase
MLQDNDYWVIIPAAGSGSRFYHHEPKQYLRLQNKTILEHSIDLFLHKNGFNKIILPLSKKDEHFAQLAIAKHQKIHIVIGGQSRAESVLNGLTYLQSIAKPLDWVLVHDAVRPCLHQNDLHSLICNLSQDDVGGILATPVADTIKSFTHHTISHTVPRDNLCHALTPQMFRFHILFDALKQCIEQNITVTDEASCVEQSGLKPKIVFANYPNPKLTMKRDVNMIAHLLAVKHQEEAFA